MMNLSAPLRFPAPAAHRQGREKHMYRHGPTCLDSPVLRGQPMCASPALPMDEKPLFGLRLNLIARIRREIADGTYDTPEKWDLALERLFDRIAQE
jgi:hypothetical protein